MEKTKKLPFAHGRSSATKGAFRLNTLSASDACADYLRDRIISGEFAEGTSIVLDRVALQIGVSHTPIREAIRRLEAEGLVSYRANHGARVRNLDPSEFEELILLRKAIEPAVLSAAIVKAEPGTFTQAKLKLEDWNCAIGGKEMLLRSWQFLRALYEPSGLGRCLEIVDNNWTLIERYHRHSWQASSGVRAKDFENKQRILEACRTRDQIEAEAALKASVHWGAEIVREHLTVRQG